MQGCLIQETVLSYQYRKYALECFEICIYSLYNARLTRRLLARRRRGAGWLFYFH